MKISKNTELVFLDISSSMSDLIQILWNVCSHFISRAFDMAKKKIHSQTKAITIIQIIKFLFKIFI